MKTLKLTLISAVLMLATENVFAGDAGFATEVVAIKDCTERARVYLRDVGHVGQARRVAVNRGYQIFHIRTNYYGGDSAYEVVTDADCKFVSRKLLWTE